MSPHTLTRVPVYLCFAILALACADGGENSDSETGGVTGTPTMTATDSGATTDSASDSETGTSDTGGSESNSDSGNSETTEGPTGDPPTTSDPTDATTSGDPLCGNGVVDPGELCDDGEQNGAYGACADDCGGPGPHCGDGILQPVEGEICDDGDDVDNNACSNTCQQVPCDQQGGNGGEVLSYIWIANDTQGTVSKINTMTAIEEARYAVEGGRPSRTSVNLNGDVAVSSRGPGAVTKVAAQLEDCVDLNQNGEIETSQGPNDILPLGDDECVLWRRPIESPDYNNGPRATAWVAEKQNPMTCEYPEARLWIAWRDADQQAHFELMDGVTGDSIAQVTHPYPNDGSATKNPYGGAVDSDGNFYVTGLHAQAVLKVDIDTLEVTDLGLPPGSTRRYGMTLDAGGNLWAAGYDGDIHRWNTADNTWDVFGSGISGNYRGIAVDSDTQIWAVKSNVCHLTQFDGNTDTYVKTDINLPDCVTPWGVAVDFEGNIWVVDRGNKAYKIDRNTYEILAVVGGLVDPYSYSDMTGSVLKLQGIG